VIPKYTEHRVFDKTCTCGHRNKGAFPENVAGPISYGSNVMATIGYLHTRQYLPFARMSEFFRDVCNLPISQGTLCNIVNAFAAKAAPAYQLIKEKVAAGKVVGTDETGIRVNGKIHWFWTWQSTLSTFIVFSLNRGGATIMSNFPLGFQKAVLVSDCWPCHFKTPCNTHQLCLAHLLRELIYHEEDRNSKWATDFKNLLYQGIELKRGLSQNQYNHPIPERDGILEKLKGLLEKPPEINHKKLHAFYRRMRKYQNYIFTFLHYHHVPPDNNGSERAIRNVKVKQKVSGQFKTEKGAQLYAVIRSVTDTCIKNGTNILDAFKTIATLVPE